MIMMMEIGNKKRNGNYLKKSCKEGGNLSSSKRNKHESEVQLSVYMRQKLLYFLFNLVKMDVYLTISMEDVVIDGVS